MTSCQDLFAALGFLTKASKAQHPAKEHIVQGVNFGISDDGITLSPTTARTAKIRAQIRKALDDRMRRRSWPAESPLTF